VVAMHGPRLGEVEGLALRNPVNDVDEHDVAELTLHRILGDGGADVAGADHGDLRASHGPVPSPQSDFMLSMMAVPNSEPFTSLAPSMRRATSGVGGLCTRVVS